MPKVSVVIPSYNRAHCVGRAIDSVLAQSHREVEAIVVDDGSTDGTAGVIDARYGHDARVRLVRQENGGVSAARNAGLRAADGDFVALLDSDDAFVPWKLEMQLACLRAHPEAGMIWTDMTAVDREGRILSERYIREMYSTWSRFPLEALFPVREPIRDLAPALAPAVGLAQLHVGMIYSQMIMGSIVHTSTVLLRRERLEAVGGFDTDLRPSGEDYDFHLRTTRLGPVAFADVPTVFYERGATDALTHGRYRVHIASNFLRTIERNIREHRGEIHLPERMLREVRAEAHAWIADAQLDLGRIGEARASLARSVALDPLRRTPLLRLLTTLLPGPIYYRLRAARRALAAGSSTPGRRGP